MAFFEGLVVDEDGNPVSVVRLGDASYYVVDDYGFRRHVDSRDVDRLVLEQFVAQLGAHREEASAAMLNMMGKEDLFTKGMVDATLRNVDVESILAHELSADVRQWLGMMGFRIVINRHGDLTRVDIPGVAADDDGTDES